MSTSTRQQVVQAMLGKTVMQGKEDVSYVARLFERLFDEDDITASILKFLCRQSSVKIRVHRYNNNKDESGRNREDYESYVDFQNHHVYLGANVDCEEEKVAGEFAKALAKMCLDLAFRNSGKPYELGDPVHEREWNRALKEVEDFKTRYGMKMDMRIYWAMSFNDQSRKNREFAAVVPWLIAEDGTSMGTAYLQHRAPLLLKLFRDYVVPMLLAKARA